MNDKKPEGGLLQSREWADVLREEKKKVVSVTVGDECFYGVEQKLPVVGTYVYFPRMKNISDSFVEKIIALTYSWVRVDVDSEEDVAVLKKSNKKILPAPHNMQPKENLIIDITKNTDDLLAQMKSKTRYNVRLAEKKGVKIIASKDKKYIDAFYKLVEDTGQRKNVTFHEKMHYKKILHILPDDMIGLYSAEYKEQIIASNLISFYGGAATYLHGATADEHRNVMAPFLLQWNIMQDAKERGCEWYDFGGVFSDVEDSGKKGITRFKKGFAPREPFYTTEGSYDIVLSGCHYSTYKFLQWFR